MKHVLFDIDGVLLSEERCFDTSALTVWEWCYGEDWMHLEGDKVDFSPSDSRIEELRAHQWMDDAIFEWIKEHGINSNWDMVHAYLLGMLALLWKQRKPISSSYSVITRDVVKKWGKACKGLVQPKPEEIFMWLRSIVPIKAKKEELFEAIVKAVEEIVGQKAEGLALGGAMWKLHSALYNEWYFGDKSIGKEGFLHKEIPLAPAEDLRDLLKDLKRAGYKIGIATGRCRKDAQIPLEELGIWEEFPELYRATSDEALEASGMYGTMLDKPHPFTYLASYGGVNRELYDDYVKRPSEVIDFRDTVYVVGDSIADVLAAKSMGATMIATLTGLTGKKILPLLQELEVEYIVENVTDLRKLLL